MKLQILVPHYYETAEEIKPLLDSIAIQQNVPFDEIGVIICHDGKDSEEFCFTNNTLLSCVHGETHSEKMTMIDGYPFEIKQIRQEHKGV